MLTAKEAYGWNRSGDPPAFPLHCEIGAAKIVLHLDGRAEFDREILEAELAKLKRSDLMGFGGALYAMVGWMLLHRETGGLVET